MARQSRIAELGLVALTIEGGLIAPEQLQKIIVSDRSPKMAASYACPKGTSLGDEIARYFRIGQALWRDYDKAEAKTITRTATFAHDLLTLCFGFTDLDGPVEHRDGTRRYRIAWEGRGGRVPIVVAPPQADSDPFAKSQPEFGDGEGGRAKRSPAALLQDWLNANDSFYWGLVFAGDRVRLMRDNASLTRPAWIEADLCAMFRDDMFADFTAFWLLAHATRFGPADAAPSDCALEQWREEGLKQGVEARADLRGNVEQALAELGQGLTEANPELAARLQSGALPMQALFEQLLRTVYRLIFLAVAEDRDLLHARSATKDARALYAAGYSFGFWRERSRRRVARDGHNDAWEALKITLAGLEHGQDMLGLPALGGLFAAGATPDLNTAKIPNRNLLAALFCLGFIRKDGITHRINWRDLKTEELGSVYESLLEIRPRLEPNGDFVLGSGAKGNDRKTSGSYYTPDSLVETLLDSALDPVLDKAEGEGEDTEASIAAILDLKVIDPACGSGHFLLGAARRMATRVARLRNEDAGKEETQAALRDVVARCIHGVDRNPMAVELAKVALWIESVSPGKPLTFLDANIRCGDALLGVFDLEALELGIPDDAYKPLTGDDKDAAKYWKAKNKDEKKGQGSFDFESGTGALPPKKLAANLSTIRRMPENTVGEVEKKREAFEAWRNDRARWNTKTACDLYTAAFLLPKTEVPDNYQRGIVPTTADVWKRLGGGQVNGPLEAAAVDASEGARAFHWPLAFPDVLIGKGGFDVVLGNPPWEVVQLAEKEYFETRVPEIAEMKGAARKAAIKALENEHPDVFLEFARDKRTFDAMTQFARASGRFTLTTSGKVNTYGLFAEQFLNMLSARGQAGVILPNGIATDDNNATYFRFISDNRRLESLYSFYEVRKWFVGTDDRRDFCLMTLVQEVDNAEFAASLISIEELNDRRRRFTLTAAEISKINPNSKTAPAFRTKKDAQLTASFYDRIPVLIEEGRGSEPGEPGNLWEVEYRQGWFNMTGDSEHFRTAEQLIEEGYERRGTDWIAITSGLDASDLDLSNSATGPAREERYVPLYEAKMFHHFDPRFGDGRTLTERPVNSGWPRPSAEELKNPNFDVTPWYWVPATEFADRVSARSWDKAWHHAFRDVTKAGNERTAISSFIPKAGVGHPAPLIFSGKDADKIAALQANLASIAFDFVARQKVGGSHLTYGYLNQLPILPPSAYSEDDLGFIVPRVLELSYTSHSMAPFARDLGYEGEPFRWDEDRRAQLRAELDAWYALAYGLTRDELRYVLDPKDVMGEDYPSETFRVLQNNEIKKYGEYRTQRLVLTAYDALAAAAPATQNLADGQWQGAIADETDVRLMLQAILKRMRTPRIPSEVRAAFLFAAQPHLLSRHLNGSAKSEWERLVGDMASLPVSQSVPTFSSAQLSHFGTSQAMLAARGIWRSDSETGKVDRGAAIYDNPIPPWTEGRADFVWHALQSIDLNASATTATLTQEEQTFLAQAAAA